MHNDSRFFLFLATLVALSVGCAGADEPGIGPVDSKEDGIVGGGTFSGVPAAGALAFGSSTFCSATLIAPTRVLTAAHCVVGSSPRGMSFITGPSGSRAVTRTPVIALRPHPSFSFQTNNNDIAYVDLASPPPGVQPVGILPRMDESFVGVELLHVGYGVSDGVRQTGSGVKRAVSIPTTQVGATQFAYGAPGRNTCNGDSGGPALFRTNGGEYLVAGVTSFGDRFCVEFGVNTRADAYADFLGVAVGAPVDPVDPADPVDPGDPVDPVDPVGQTLTDSASLPRGRAQFYDNIPVAPGTTLRAVLTGTGDADLYVQWNGRPSREAFACRPFLETANERCELSVPSGVSEAFVAVDAFTDTNYTIEVRYQN